MKSIIHFFSVFALVLFPSLSMVAQKIGNDLNMSQFVVKNNSFSIPLTFISEEETSALKSSSQGKLSINLTNSGRLKSAAATQLSGDTLLNENFEAFTGSDQSWLPTGWTRKVTNTYTPKNTWFIGIPEKVANSGQYVSFIEFDYDNQSDEWLITPELTLGAQNDLIFYLLSNPSEMYFKDKYGVIHKDQVTATLQVMISVDGGEFTKIFDATEDASYSSEEFEEVGYRQMHVKLHDYASKKIKIAFRYIGKGGGSMGVDDIFVGNLYPSAWYYRPIGTYYNGFSDDVAISPGYFVPAYKKMRFVNDSWYSERYYWDGIYKDGYPYLDSEEYSPEFSVSTDAAELPYLTSYLDAKNNTFQYSYRSTATLKAGHYGYAMNLDLNNSITTAKFSNSEYFLFGTCKYTSTTPEQKSYSYEAVGNWFEKPAQKALVSNVSVFLGTLAGPADTELTLDAMKVDEKGNLILMTSGTLKISDAKSVGADFKVLNFTLNDTLTIDYPILYMLRGFNVPNVSLGVYSNNYSDMQESNAFVLVKYDDQEQKLMSAIDRYRGRYSLLFVPYLAFPVLHPEDKEEIICGTTAGTASISVETTFTPDKIKIYTDENWISLSGATFDNSPSKYLFNLSFSYEALPVGIRSSTIRITQPGTDDLVIPVKQGVVSSIKGTTIPQPQISNNGSAFEMNYASVNLLEIYSVSGLKLQEVNLPSSGIYSFDHKYLPSGVYILKFSGKNGSYSTKVTK